MSVDELPGMLAGLVHSHVPTPIGDLNDIPDQAMLVRDLRYEHFRKLYWRIRPEELVRVVWDEAFKTGLITGDALARESQGVRPEGA